MTRENCGLESSVSDWPRIWFSCARRTHSWPSPPRWSTLDWREEIDAESLVAACEAIDIFDPTRGPSLGSFVYHKILSAALARYRREWSYALRLASSSDQDAAASQANSGDTTEQEGGRVRDLIIRLPRVDRLLLEGLFWRGLSESDVAAEMGVSKQAVNKRKRRVLLQLKHVFEKTDEM